MTAKPALSDRVHPKPGQRETGQPRRRIAPLRSWRIDPRHALVGAALGWTGFAAMVGIVLTGHGQAFDAAGLLFWRSGADMVPRRPTWLLEAVRDMTALGGVLLRHLFAAAAITALLFMALRREAILLAGTIIGGWAVNSAIKALVGRPRPEIVPHLTEAGGASFPSGHSFNAAVVYVGIALAFAALSPRRSVRWTVIGAALVLTGLIAVSRVWLGVHFPTDVTAGWLGGVAWAFTAAAVLDQPAKAAADASTGANSG